MPRELSWEAWTKRGSRLPVSKCVPRQLVLNYCRRFRIEFLPSSEQKTSVKARMLRGGKNNKKSHTNTHTHTLPRAHSHALVSGGLKDDVDASWVQSLPHNSPRRHCPLPCTLRKRVGHEPGLLRWTAPAAERRERMRGRLKLLDVFSSPRNRSDVL